MRKTKTEFKWMEYPPHDGYRGGAKVAWYTYRKIEDARAAAEAARHNAIRQEQLGYDFGYQTPGNIIQIADGVYEVCIP